MALRPRLSPGLPCGRLDYVPGARARTRPSRSAAASSRRHRDTIRPLRERRLLEHPEFLDQPLYRAVYEPETIERMKTTVRDEYAARAWTTWMKVMTPVAQENLRQIAAAGGVIVLGSDQSAGPQSHRELELMVEGGIPPLEAIRIGTLNAAIFLGRERDMGSIEIGKLADMVLLTADPLADIANAAMIEAVIKGGRVSDRAALDLPVNRRR